MTSIKHLLIDGDILVYSTAFALKDKSIGLAKSALDATILGIADTLGCREGTFFLTGYDQFRRNLYPSYKEHRKDAPRPEHGSALRSYLISDYDAISLVGIEADDGLGILQGILKDKTSTCIVTTDKDLDQIPGWHYNFKKRKLYWTTPEEGEGILRASMLVGDVADNIKGIRGIGPKKAVNYTTDEAVKEVYKEHCREPDYEKNLKLLTILTSPELPSYVTESIGKDSLQTLRTTLDSCIGSLTSRLEGSTSDESSTGSPVKVSE
jgi:5'-3' exonuclease